MTYATFKKRMIVVLSILGLAAIISLVSLTDATTSELKITLSLVALALDGVAASILIPTVNKHRKDPRP